MNEWPWGLVSSYDLTSYIQGSHTKARVIVILALVVIYNSIVASIYSIQKQRL
jgi:hypothetical protein